MPEYQGYYKSNEGKRETYYLEHRARSSDDAIDVFLEHCPEDMVLRAVTEENDGVYKVVYGKGFTSLDMAEYKKKKRIPASSFDHDHLEDVLVREKSRDILEPDLDELAKRNSVPGYFSMFSSLGWFVVVLSIVGCLASTFVMPFSLGWVFLVSIVSLSLGFFLVSIGWVMPIINRIMIVSQYQAELSQYQSHKNKVREIEKRIKEPVS